MKILFGSYKGGPGKSTWTTNFASILAGQGRDVLMIDADNQGSLTMWASIRSRNGITPSMTCMSGSGEELHAEINRMAPKFDDVIIDTAGHDSLELRSAMIVADVLITPVEVSVFSTGTLGKIQAMVRQAKVFNPTLKCFLVPNRVSTNKARGDAQIARLHQLADQLPEYVITKNACRERASIGDVSETGQCGVETSDPKAVAEIMAIFNEIQEHLKEAQ
jgi:chromosome partitioning protein